MTDFLDVLDKILDKNFVNLSDYELAFLKARRDYLNDEQKEQLNIIVKEQLDNLDNVEVNNQEENEIEPKIDGRSKAARLLKQQRKAGEKQ